MSKLHYGVGVNSKGKHKANQNNKATRVYNVWRHMMKRCYLPQYQIDNPTYAGCSIDSEWHDFQDFAEWYNENPYSSLGYELDKDILFTGNKLYSSKTCCFIPQEINKLLNAHKFERGVLPQGVHFFKETGEYRAQIMLDGKKTHLGYFDCPNEAFQVYKQAKEANVKRMALEWRSRIADNVFQALMNWQLTE